MNELDKKIAELKGYYNPAEVNEFECASCGYEILSIRSGDYKMINGQWSTSDAKAFELVDELGMEFKIEGKQSRWSAVFDVYGQHHQETSQTRPEAICRAYIAAVEWMKEKE
jgi:hypothetical protein